MNVTIQHSSPLFFFMELFKMCSRLITSEIFRNGSRWLSFLENVSYCYISEMQIFLSLELNLVILDIALKRIEMALTSSLSSFKILMVETSQSEICNASFQLNTTYYVSNSIYI